MPETPQGKTEPEPKEILLPKHQIRPLARGLIQLFANPIREIKENMPSTENEPDDFFREFIGLITPSLEKVADLLNRLQTAREVKLVIKPEGGEFHTSLETEEDTPEEGVVTIDDNLAPILLRELSHNLGHPLADVVGYSEIAYVRSSSEEIRNQAEIVNNAAIKIVDLLDPIRNAHKLEITTNNEEKTTIKPINNI